MHQRSLERRLGKWLSSKEVTMLRNRIKAVKFQRDIVIQNRRTKQNVSTECAQCSKAQEVKSQQRICMKIKQGRSLLQARTNKVVKVSRNKEGRKLQQQIEVLILQRDRLIQWRKQKLSVLYRKQQPWKQTTPQGAMHGASTPYISGWPAHDPYTQGGTAGIQPRTPAAAVPSSLPHAPPPPYPFSAADPRLLQSLYSAYPPVQPGLDKQAVDSAYGINGYLKYKPSLLDHTQALTGPDPYRLPGFPVSFGQHLSPSISKEAIVPADFSKSNNIHTVNSSYPETKVTDYATPAANVYSEFQKFESNIDSQPTYLDDGHGNHLPPIGTYLKGFSRQNEHNSSKLPEYPSVLSSRISTYPGVTAASPKATPGGLTFSTNEDGGHSRPHWSDEKISSPKDKLKKHLSDRQERSVSLSDRQERSVSTGSQVPPDSCHDNFFTSSDGGRPHNTTSVSAPTRPVMSVDTSLISLPPREFEQSAFKDPYSKANASNKASKVAADICREASKQLSTSDPFERASANSMNIIDMNRVGQLKSPFQPTDINSKVQKPQPYRPSSNSSANVIDFNIPRPGSNQSTQSFDGKSYRPGSNQSAHAVEFRSPVDFKEENNIQKIAQAHSAANHVDSVPSDFWSQFGAFPPNIALDHSSSGLQGTHVNAIKDQQQLPSTSTHPNTSFQAVDVGLHQNRNIGNNKDTSDRKRVEKSKRKPIEVDPHIRDKVNAKVQEIMAACRQKEQERANLSKASVDQTRSQTLMHSSVSKDAVSSSALTTEPTLLNSHSNATSMLKRAEKSEFANVKRDTFVESFVKENVSSQSVVSEYRGSVPWNKKEVSAFDPRKVCHNQTGQGLSVNDNRKKVLPWNYTEMHKESHGDTVSVDAKGINLIKGVNPFVSEENEKYDRQKTERKLWQNILAPPSTSQSNITVPGSSVHCCGECKKVGVNYSEHCKNREKCDMWKDARVAENLKEIKGIVGPLNSDWTGSKQMKHVQHDSGTMNCKTEKYDQQSYGNDLSDFMKKENVQDVFKPFNGDIKSDVHKQFLEGWADAKHHLQRVWKKESNMRDHIRSMLHDEKKEPFSGDPYKFEESAPKTVSSQGLNLSKKIGSKSYGYKSSFSSFKKIHKPYRPKLVKSVPLNEKAKKVHTRDNFSEKLMKNLGFPPLTQQDLITKRQKISNKVINGFQESTSCLLNADDKCERVDEVPFAETSPPLPAASASSISSAVHAPVSSAPSQINSNEKARTVKDEIHASRTSVVVKPFRRSRSMESLCCKLGDSEMFRKPRSRSLERVSVAKGRNFIESTEPHRGFDISMQVDDDRNVPVSDLNVEKITAQISQLKDMVTGEPKDSELHTNTVVPVPKCLCLGPDSMFNEAVEGPYYNHLGSAPSVEAMRTMLEQRLDLHGSAIRIEKVRYTGKEGKSSQGCPIAKWVIRRSSADEKYLAVVRHRPGHFCEQAWLIIGLVAWEGVPTTQADDLYDYLCKTLPKNGHETERRCGTNERKMCACQGIDLKKRGASFSFGCSWSMYYNGCKFARSQVARKFKLKDSSKEALLEDKLQDLATQLGPLYKQSAPKAHYNQSYYSMRAGDCRLGREPGGPFSGVTACVDFCAHAHKDIHNMNNGSTVVVTLTKHRGLSKPDDEQLHVLPLYVLEPTDEQGSFDGQYEKIKNGSLEVLHNYPLEARIRSYPLASCKKRQNNPAKKGMAKKRTFNPVNGRNSPFGASYPVQCGPKKKMVMKDRSVRQSKDLNLSMPGQTRAMPGVRSNNETSINTKHTNEAPLSYEGLMALSSETGFNTMRKQYWEYFYTNGVFPPSSLITGSKHPTGISDHHMGHKKDIYKTNERGHHVLEGFRSTPHPAYMNGRMNADRNVVQNIPQSQLSLSQKVSTDRENLSNQNVQHHHISLETKSVTFNSDSNDHHRSPSVPLEHSKMAAAHSEQHRVPVQSSSAIVIQNPFSDHPPMASTRSAIHPEKQVDHKPIFSSNPVSTDHQSPVQSAMSPWYSAINVKTAAAGAPLLNQPSGSKQSSQHQSNAANRPEKSLSKSWDSSHMREQIKDNGARSLQSPLELLSKAVELRSKDIDSFGSKMFSDYLGPKNAELSEKVTSVQEKQPVNVEECNSVSSTGSVHDQMNAVGLGNDPSTSNAEMQSKIGMETSGLVMPNDTRLHCSAETSSGPVKIEPSIQNADVVGQLQASHSGDSSVNSAFKYASDQIPPQLPEQSNKSLCQEQSEILKQFGVNLFSPSRDIEKESQHISVDRSNQVETFNVPARVAGDHSRMIADLSKPPQQPGTALDDKTAVHCQNPTANSPFGWSDRSNQSHETGKNVYEASKLTAEQNIAQIRAASSNESSRVSSDLSKETAIPHDLSRTSGEVSKPPHGQISFYDAASWSSMHTTSFHDSLKVSHSHPTLPRQPVSKFDQNNASKPQSMSPVHQTAFDLSHSSNAQSRQSSDHTRPSHTVSSSLDVSKLLSDQGNSSFDLSKSSQSQVFTHDHNRLPSSSNNSPYDFSKSANAAAGSQMHSTTTDINASLDLTKSATSHGQLNTSHQSTIESHYAKTVHDQWWLHGQSNSYNDPHRAKQDMPNPTQGPTYSQRPVDSSKQSYMTGTDLSNQTETGSHDQLRSTSDSYGIQDLSKQTLNQAGSHDQFRPATDPYRTGADLCKQTQNLTVSHDQFRSVGDAHRVREDLTKQTHNQLKSRDELFKSRNEPKEDISKLTHNGTGSRDSHDSRSAPNFPNPQGQTQSLDQATHGSNRPPHSLPYQYGRIKSEVTMENKLPPSQSSSSSVEPIPNSNNQYSAQNHGNNPKSGLYPGSDQPDGQYSKQSGHQHQPSTNQNTFSHGVANHLHGHEQTRSNPNHPIWSMYNYSEEQLAKHEQLTAMTQKFIEENYEESSLDPNILKCEMEYNEAAFRDPEIGGVAIALCHGAVLFEVAKRELHATTGLKNPNRYHPTRISLVFYQHKQLNNELHGRYAYAKKLEDMKQQRINKMQQERGFVNMTEIENSFKGGKKRKMDEVNEEDDFDIMNSSAAQYRYMMDCNARRDEAFTTSTVSTKWIAPQPMVTGPYQKWI